MPGMRACSISLWLCRDRQECRATELDVIRQYPRSPAAPAVGITGTSLGGEGKRLLSVWAGLLGRAHGH